MKIHGLRASGARQQICQVETIRRKCVGMYIKVALLVGLLFEGVVVAEAQTTSAGDLIAEIITPEPANDRPAHCG